MFLLEFSILLLIFVLPFWCYLNKVKKYSGIYKIKGPKPLPFIGNVLDFGTNTSDIFYYQVKLVKKYGSFVKYWIGPKLVVLLSDAEYIEKVLGSEVNIEKSNSYHYFEVWLGQGLVLSRGEYWRNHRKIITPTFHFKIVQEYLYFINKNLKILHQKLAECVGKRSIDVKLLLSLYTLDIISEAAMNKSINAQINANPEYVEAIRGITILLVKRMFSLIGQSDFLYKFTSDCKQLNEYIKTVKKFTREVLANVITERTIKKLSIDSTKCKDVDEFGRKPRKVFIELLLDLKEEANTFTYGEIEDQVETFMFAGHDTLSSTISFCLYELARHRDVQKRLVEESNAIIGTDKNCEITYEAINELKYLECCVKECMRLWTTAPFIERQLSEKIVIDGITIPEGTIIQPFFFMLHRNEKYYPNPEKFDPDRFAAANSRNRHPYAYLPFSAGPRNCIGFRYALLAVKATVISILRNFEVCPAEPDEEIILMNNGILSSTNEICVQFKFR